MKYGYARVSTDDQKADLQIAALKKTGCEHAQRLQHGNMLGIVPKSKRPGRVE
jgi:DNA invertase Pin-like site-specific DNA recombinase